jgi:O-antigen/teichoic acid export membrane protein
VLGRAASLLLVPLFTRVLSPAEYGQIGVLVAISALVATIASLGLETPMVRGYVHAGGEPGARRAFVNTVGGFALAAAGVISLLGVLVAGPLATAFGVPEAVFRITVLSGAATAALTVVPLAILRAEERFRDYLTVSMATLAVTTSLSVLLVAILRLGVPGWVTAHVIGSIAALAVGLAILGHRWTREFDGGALRRALRLGVPILPHALSHWGLGISDRLILGTLVAAAALGPYHVAYQVAAPIMIVAVAMSNATNPMFAEAMRSVDLRHQLARASTVQAVIVVISASAVAVLGPPLIELILPAAYAVGGDYLPWIALGLAFFGLYLIPMNAIAVMAGRTELVWVITVVSAAVNIGLNLLLVPTMGPLAAAIATAVGYGVLLGGVIGYMRWVVVDPIPFELGRLAAGMAIVVSAALLAVLVSPPSAGAAFAIGMVVLGVAALVVGRLLFPRELSLAAGMLRSRPHLRSDSP